MRFWAASFLALVLAAPGASAYEGGDEEAPSHSATSIAPRVIYYLPDDANNGAWAPGAQLRSVGERVGERDEVEHVIDRHSHAIVIGRVRHILQSKYESALAYWHGRYVVIDRDEDVARLAVVGVPWGARSAG